jgi:hypothetical protein
MALSFPLIRSRLVSVHQLGDLSRPPHERDDVALHLVGFLCGCCWPFVLHGVHEGVKVLDVLVQCGIDRLEHLVVFHRRLTLLRFQAIQQVKPRGALPFDGWILPATRLSDHASFWDAGWPALMVTDTAFFRNPNYHLPSDIIDTLDFEFMAQLVKSLELALVELPPLPQSPTLAGHRVTL